MNLLWIKNTFWIRLARKEFLDQILFRGENEKDIFWLCFLMMFIMLCSFIAVGSKTSVTEQLIDLTLGRLPDRKIPVWIQLPYENKFKKIKINNTEKSLTIHPHWEISEKYIKMPQENIWGHSSKLKGITQNEPFKFKGIAVTQNDPLWKAVINQSNDSNFNNSYSLIILDRSRFSYYFGIKNYVESLENKLPKSLYKDLPKDMEEFVKHKHIWLYLALKQQDEGGNQPETNELTKLNILWLNHIPVPGDYSFIIYSSMYQILDLLDSYETYNKLFFYPEIGLTNKGKRVLSITLNLKDNNKKDTFLNCLNVHQKEREIKFQYPKPLFWVNECLNQAEINLDEKDIEYEPNTVINCDDNEQIIKVPCSILTAEKRKDMGCKNKNDLFRIDFPRKPISAYVYAQDRKELESIIDTLNIQNDDSKPHINFIYKEAYNRFATLLQLVEILSSSYFYVFIGFLFVIILAQLGVIINHRIHYFGIFLAKGMTRKHIHCMMFLYSFFSTCVGFFAAYIVFYIMNIFVNNYFINNSNIQMLAVNKLPELLYLQLSEYILIFTSIYLLCCMVILFIMPFSWSLKPPKITIPDQLIKD